MTEDEDSQFRAGQLMGRMQTLKEVMARLNETPMDNTSGQAIFETLAARHLALGEWIRQTIHECETELEVLDLESGT